MTAKQGCCRGHIWRFALLPAALLAFFLWYLIRQQKTAPQQPETRIKLPPLEPEVIKKPAAAKPMVPGKADDLTRIGGIGPKAAVALKTAGIDSFAALAAAAPALLRQILAAAGMRIVNPESWKQQAKFAAAADWEGLAAFNAKRKAAAGKS